MKYKALSLVSMAALLASQSLMAAPLATDEEKLSYAIGADFGSNFKKQGIQLNSTAFTQGLNDALAGTKLQMTKEERQATIQKFQQELMAKTLKSKKDSANKNKQIGEAFLAKNAKKPGVVVLENGLQYKVLVKGKGTKPATEDTVTVDYTGRLINGKVFDSSEKTGKPASFKLNQVIPGWTQALQLMQEGATWEIYIPSKFAYGSRGIGGPIGPNETLIFKIHLISIKK